MGSEAVTRQSKAAQPVKMSMLLRKSHPAEFWEHIRKQMLSQKKKGPYGPFESLSGQNFFIGIIDFLIPWTCKKQAEYAVKACQCQGRKASVNPPWSYARRQIDFIQQML